MFGLDTTADGDLLAARATATPERTALVASQTGERWTYRELDDAVDETARALSARSGSPGSSRRLAAALSTSPEFVVTVHATLRLGWEFLPVNTALTSAELSDQLRRGEPTMALSDRESQTLFGEALEGIDVEHVSVEGPADAGPEPLLRETSDFDPLPASLEETALVLFTSGTTGQPKGVRLTRGNLLASAVASAFRLGVSPDDRWLCCLPMYHMGGLAPAIRTVLYGTTLVLQPSFDAAETADLIAEEGITGVSLVPTQLERLLDVGLTGDTLETVLLGGAPARESLLDRARDAGVPVYPTYGLTETASQVATARPSEHERHPGTVGTPLLGTRVRILRDGRPVDPGESGEIVVDGPTVTPGYLDDQHTESAFGEWGLHTGDVGYTDDAGRLWVQGRRDDQIVTGGELVAPAEVVSRLRAVPGVADAAVVGLEDPEWGERVSALVVPESTVEATAELRERIVDHCQANLASYKRPKTLRIADAIPRTHSGTVDRDTVRDRLRAGDS